MSPGLFIGIGTVGLLLSGYKIVRTIVTGTATLRGGLKTSRAHNSHLYWANFAALCVLLLISAWMIYLGGVPDPFR